tara:strand:- start:287 stop:631 length:345 start_codon:yes stop_codon:yes gene_type:complete
MLIELTVADHEANGFIGLAKWIAASESEARHAIDAIDALVDDDMEPDNKTCDFSFVLDLRDPRKPWDMIDTGKRALPLQIAMRLAPEQTSAWLATRPDPDSCPNYGQRLPGLPQ